MAREILTHFRGIDIARAAGTSTQPVLTAMEKLGLNIERTPAGQRRYTRAQAEQILKFIDRRRAERQAT